jgi:hypothetical protein
MSAAPSAIPPEALARACLDRLDAVAVETERRWGVDRLPKLVTADLAVRFRGQAERLDEAIRSNRHEAVAVQAEAMLRAWSALDAAATKAGWQPLSPTVWEAVLPTTGEVIAIVRDADEAGLIVKDRGGAVWTLDEVAIAIEAFGDGVKAAKRAFPGAEVTAVRPSSLPIGSGPPVAAADRDPKPSPPQQARSRRRRSPGFSGVHAPLLGSKPASSNLPPIDWDRGDDIPF